MHTSALSSLARVHSSALSDAVIAMSDDTQPLNEQLDQLLQTAYGITTQEAVAKKIGLSKHAYRRCIGCDVVPPQHDTWEKFLGAVAGLSCKDAAGRLISKIITDKQWLYKPTRGGESFAPTTTNVLEALWEVSQGFGKTISSAVRPPSTTLSGDIAWKFAELVVRLYEDRHLYVDLLSVIPPSWWSTDNKNWANHQRLLYQLLHGQQLDAARRLHIFDLGHLPENFARSLDENASRACTFATNADTRLFLEQSRTLLVAEYLSGIRARALFLCKDSSYSDRTWPKLNRENAWIFDAACFYQSHSPASKAEGSDIYREAIEEYPELANATIGDESGYRVILTNLKPFEASTELTIYAFQPEYIQSIYWMLRANFYSLLRQDSPLLLSVFDLVGEYIDPADKTAIWEYLPLELKAKLDEKGEWFEKVVWLYGQNVANKVTREFDFEHALKEWLLGPERNPKGYESSSL